MALPAAVVIGILLLASCSSRTQPRYSSSTLGPAQQARLERGLAAGLVRVESAVIAPQVRAAFMRKGRLLLPAGSHLVIKRPTFRQLTSETAVVDAVVTGPSPGRWQLMLFRHSGQWLLIGTRRL